MRRRPSRSTRAARAPWWRRPAATLATAAIGVGGAAALLTERPAGVPVAQISAAPLAGAGGAALFSEANLAPGRAVTRCVVIDHHGTAGSVRLAADDLSGDLAPYLSLTIAVGTGGSRGSCAGFTGGVTYTGLLTGLADGQAATRGVSTGWEPRGGTESRTYRITVRVADDNAAQGKTTATTLRWLLVPASSAPVVSPPVSSAPAVSPPVSSAPVVSPPASSAPVVSPPASSAPVVSPSGSAAPVVSPSGSAAPHPAPAAVPAGPGTTDGRSKVWPRVRHMLAVAAKVAAQAARHATIPLLAILLALLFLAVQDHIDRRDPKLSLAPLSRDRYLAPGEHSEEDLLNDDR